MKIAVSLLLSAAFLPVAALAAPVPGKVIRDARFAPEMVVLPAGTATLGSTEAETTREGRAPAAAAAWERPQRTVTLPSYAVGKYHVTRKEFAAFVEATGRNQLGCLVAHGETWSDGPLPDKSFRDVGFPQGDDEPVLCVNFEDANAYAAWLTAKTHHKYRLMNEAEWEYAARGGTTTARWWGDDVSTICAHANGGDRDYAAAMPADKTANLACSDGFARTSPVGHFPANPFGLHDMYGNAWQWVSDCFTIVPGATPPAEPCKARSIRGGSWHNSASTLRSATRSSLPIGMRSSSLGFRVMREIP